MGYYYGRDHIRNNQRLLDSILAAIDSGEDLMLSSTPDTLQADHFKIRDLLNACDTFIDECDGRYANLGEKVRIKRETSTAHLIISSKVAISLKPIAAKAADEHSILSVLEADPSSMKMLKFTPSDSFDEDEFATAAKQVGWRVHVATLSISADGSISVGAERINLDSLGANFDSLVGGDEDES